MWVNTVSATPGKQPELQEVAYLPSGRALSGTYPASLSSHRAGTFITLRVTT